mmetsp:Transcript_13486/g.18843  ORF Transcript_13486/g.18843 Transcript_13486/m.18843 type:complete len:205 (+) Transcript_13486:196-810(+)
MSERGVILLGGSGNCGRCGSSDGGGRCGSSRCGSGSWCAYTGRSHGTHIVKVSIEALAGLENSFSEGRVILLGSAAGSFSYGHGAKVTSVASGSTCSSGGIKTELLLNNTHINLKVTNDSLQVIEVLTDCGVVTAVGSRGSSGNGGSCGSGGSLSNRGGGSVGLGGNGGSAGDVVKVAVGGFSTLRLSVTERRVIFRRSHTAWG